MYYKSSLSSSGEGYIHNLNTFCHFDHRAVKCPLAATSKMMGSF